MSIDTNRPVHVVFAAPWESVVDVRPRRSPAEQTWWTFPDDVADGDTVITVVDAHEPAIVGLSVLRMDSDDDWDLVAPDDSRRFDAISIAAVAKRTGIGFSIDPRTLHRTEAAAVLEAIGAERTHPTPWFRLRNACTRGERPDMTPEGRLWGCNACGRDWDGQYAPRFQTHIESRSPFGGGEPLVVCPSCHDILHQPLGPGFDELMFSNRVPCPVCHEHRTFHLLLGMPVGPPPYGTVARGCVVTGEDADFLCGACGHEWQRDRRTRDGVSSGEA